MSDTTQTAAPDAAEAAYARHLYFVWGGVFTGPDWADLEPGTEECHGPFHTAREAERAWGEKARRGIDVAFHRLFVLAVPRPGGGNVGSPKGGASAGPSAPA